MSGGWNSGKSSRWNLKANNPQDNASNLKNCKPGGLDVRDQSRSRSRTSIASRLTFENRRDYPSRRDQLLLFLGRDF